MMMKIISRMGEMHFKNFTTVANGKIVKSNVEKMKRKLIEKL